MFQSNSRDQPCRSWVHIIVHIAQIISLKHCQKMLRLAKRQLYRNYSSSASAAPVQLTNVLKDSPSPYLQAHKSNPVAWQEWNKDTLKLAREANKPLFLSIGYNSCHWCHVMNDESFNNPAIAEKLNKNFIPVKVDREERPDLDAIYQMYQQVSSGSGGWPLNVFVLPETLEPIYGGTYWEGPETEKKRLTEKGEPVNKEGMVDEKPQSAAKFSDVLDRVGHVWNADPQWCIDAGKDTGDKLKNLLQLHTVGDPLTDAPFDEAMYEDTREHFEAVYDARNGGFGTAPKFPCAYQLSFMLNHPEMQKDTNMPTDLPHMALHTLAKIAVGGIKDQVGNGVARYSVSADWVLPHFEKMLYDQALLLEAYCDAYNWVQIHDEPHDWYSYVNDMIRDLTIYLTSGDIVAPKGFYAGVDADSQAEDGGKMIEGGYYLWTAAQFHKALQPMKNPMDRDMAAAYFDIQDMGNVTSDQDPHNELWFQNVLAPNYSYEKLGKTFGKKPNHVEAAIKEAKTLLRKYREENRVAPEVDSKIVTAWNGLAIGALAKASVILKSIDPELAETALAKAISSADFILEEHVRDSHGVQELARFSSNGVLSTSEGTDADFAFLISGLLNLYDVTGDRKYLENASSLQDSMITKMYDTENGGFYAVSTEVADELLFRPKTTFDASEPSPNGVALTNLQRLQRHGIDATNVGRPYEGYEGGIIGAFKEDIRAQPWSYTTFLV